MHAHIHTYTHSAWFYFRSPGLRHSWACIEFSFVLATARDSTCSEEDKAQQQLYNRTVPLESQECRLPCPLTPALFRSPPWEVPRLMQAKQELNSTKDKLNNVDIGAWGKHTFFTNRAGLVVPKLRDSIQPEMCTIAWAKMYEMLVFQDLLPAESSAAAQSSPGVCHQGECLDAWHASTQPRESLLIIYLRVPGAVE
eukprot:1160704-Pelagomonas_calceolata.AAC.11